MELQIPVFYGTNSDNILSDQEPQAIVKDTHTYLASPTPHWYRVVVARVSPGPRGVCSYQHISRFTNPNFFEKDINTEDIE